MSRIVLCVLLLCASACVGAREVRMHGANGDGGTCPEIAAAMAAAEARTAKPHATSAPASRSSKPAKPATARGGDDGSTRLQAPRWHSFLPGMFR
jgi:hypothetical protein